MPILDTQRRVTVLGHIRLGERVTRDGRTFPRALRGFRFTTPRRTLADAVAAEYGGTVTEWANPSNGLAQFELVTDVNEMPVLVPPAELSFSQSYELWSEGGCLRVCDGYTETRSGGEPQACLCAAEGSTAGDRACDSVTRLNLLLPAVPVFGVWRLVTHSYYASGELLSAVELALGLAQRRAQNLAAATLRIEQRVTKRNNEPPHRFTVPVLDVVLDSHALEGPAGIVGPTLEREPSRAHLDAATAVSVVGLPAPAPRIDRGAASPPPRPLTDEDAQRPIDLEVRSPSADSGHLEPAPAGGASNPLPPAGAPSDAPPAQYGDPRTQRMRRMFAVMAKLWPADTKEERDARRAVIALMETARLRDGKPCTSWAELDARELAAVEARVHDIETGHLTMAAIEGGYALTSQSGRTLRVTRDADSTEWNYEVTEPKQ